MWSAAAAIPSLAKAARPVIDYAGILLVGLGASGLTLATSWGGGEYAWGSPMIIGLFVGFRCGARRLRLGGNPCGRTDSADPAVHQPGVHRLLHPGFIVGFAMLGALTFLPTFMQFVDGVSATTSGLRTLPMVAGMLITSIGSGIIVGRTGRYKIFPVAGTAIMAVGFVLLSRMDAGTPTWQQSVYLFVLGTGHRAVHAGARADRAEHLEFRRSRRGHIGRDLLPHHRKFLRRSHIRLAVHQLPRRPDRACAGGKRGAAARRRSHRRRCTQLSPEMAAPIVDAYADSLGTVFLCAVPVAVVGFVVSLFLKEVPLREMDAMSATDLGEGFGMPSTESPDKILEVAIGRLMRNTPEIRLRSIAGQAGCESDIAAAVGADSDLPAEPGIRLGAADRHRRAPPGTDRGHRVDVRPAGGPGLCAAHR